MALTPLAAVILGVVLALWLGAAIWALSSGQRRRREGMQAQGKLDRLSALIASAPAAPIVIPSDGRLEAAERLAKWLGKRSEERRVGKESVSKCSSRGSPYHTK